MDHPGNGRCRRAAKNECGAVAELVKLCTQDKSAAELAAFAQGKQAEFEQVGSRVGRGGPGVHKGSIAQGTGHGSARCLACRTREAEA